MTRSQRVLVLAAAVGFALAVGLPAARATNYCGNQDHGIWLVQAQPSGYGSWSEIQKVNDSLVACTSGAQDGYAAAVHTAGVAFSLSGSSFVEVGLHRSVSCGLLGCTIRNRVFGEFGFYPDVYGPFFYTSYSTGGTVDMKVTNVPGTWDWKLYWDNPNGGALTWELLDRFDGMSAQYGWAWGEHARFGRTGTGGFDHHYDMQRKNSSGTWVDINSLKCWIDSDADWEWRDISDTEFIIQEGNRACTPAV